MCDYWRFELCAEYAIHVTPTKSARVNCLYWWRALAGVGGLDGCVYFCRLLCLPQASACGLVLSDDLFEKIITI